MPMTRQEYDAEIKAIRETFDKYGRSPRELTWLAIQPYLESQGYLLNPRYRPDWVPSWIQRGWTMDKAMIRCLGDTHMMSYAGNVMDALGPSQTKVVLKRMGKGSHEEKFTKYLDSLEKDEMNHLIPLLDTVDCPDTGEVFLVTPMFREIGRGSIFHCCEEVIDFIQQMLDGLIFLHNHKLAHRDICRGNIVMDATHVVPSGFRFYEQDAQDICDYRRIKFRKRCRVKVPVRYYFIDFQTVRHYPDGIEHARTKGCVGQYRDAPEMSNDVLYNPFPVDVHQLGRTFFNTFDDYKGLDDIKPFFSTLMEPDVIKRPTASQARALFDELVRSLGSNRRKYLVCPTTANSIGIEDSPPSIISRALVRLFPRLSGIL